MASNRFNQPATSTPWTSKVSFPSSSTLFSTSDLATPESKADANMSLDDITEQLTKVSITDTVRAALIDTNTNFDDLCNQMDTLSVSQFRANTLREADLVANRVEADLALMDKASGETKVEEEQNHRLTIAHVVQSYRRCIELDIEKWKERMRERKMSEADIAAVKIVIRTFVPWDERPYTHNAYVTDKLEKPNSNTLMDQISFVQLALNYWRSTYFYIRDYEKLIGAKPLDYEKQIWELEQTSLTYRCATNNETLIQDINGHRLREPQNIDPWTGKPMAVKDIQDMIRKQQEKAGYKMTK